MGERRRSRHPSTVIPHLLSLPPHHLLKSASTFSCSSPPQASTFYFDLLSQTLLPLLLLATFTLIGKTLRRRHAAASARVLASSSVAATATRSLRSGTATGEEQPLPLFVADVCSDLCFFTLFLTYPSVCATIFHFFVPLTFGESGGVTTTGDGGAGGVLGDGASAALGAAGEEPYARLLRADLSIDMDSPTYAAFSSYAVLMLLVYPLGVPLLYGLLLFRSRRELRELRRIELTQEAEYQIAVLRAAADGEVRGKAGRGKEGEMEALGMESRRQALLLAAEEAHDEASASLDEIRSRLPTTLRKLTAGCECHVAQSRGLAA